MTIFSESQKIVFSALVAANDYPAAYRYAADAAEASGSGSYATVAWLRQSADVNEGIGPLSDFIRTYSANQYAVLSSIITTSSQSSIDCQH